MPESFPTTFGRYTLIERLGMGGMAEVFLAEVAGPASFSKRVVVKRLLPELTSDEEVVARFLEEARLSAKFAHPNVVQVFELGDVDGDYYIAMEYVAGADLRRIERLLWPSCAEVPIGIAAAVAASVCRALEHVHTLAENGTPLGIVHRDVSPSNVLLSFEGGVKLIDFGVARAHAHARITRHGTAIMGKLVYASPEQVLGLGVTPRSDLFSAGCLLYEALTSVRPFERDTEPATLHAITREAPRPPSQLRPGLPKVLDDVILRALARNPADRWPTAGQMAQALESFIADRSQLIGTPQIAGFVRAALEDQDALTVTRMGDGRLEKQLRGGTPGPAAVPSESKSAPRSSKPPPAPAAPEPPAAPAGLEELPTIVEPGASAPVAAVPASPSPSRRASSARREVVAVPGPSDWAVPDEEPPASPPRGDEDGEGVDTGVDSAVEEDLPTMVQASAEPAPVRPQRPQSLVAPVGLEEISTAVVPPESVAELVSTMATVTPVSGPARPLFGVPEGMPADTVIEDGEDGQGSGTLTTSGPGPDDELGDIPSEPTRIDASRDLLAAEPPGGVHEDLPTEPPPQRSGRLAPRAPLDDEDDESEDASTGAGVAFLSPPPVAEERVRMQYAPTVSAMPAFSVQPGGPLVASTDTSSAAATYALGASAAAAIIGAPDESTAAPTLAASVLDKPLQVADDSTVAPTVARPGGRVELAPRAPTEWSDPGVVAPIAPRRPVPLAFLGIAGAVAIGTAVLVAVLLSGDDEPLPPPAPSPALLPPLPRPSQATTQAPPAGRPSHAPPSTPQPAPPEPTQQATTVTEPAPADPATEARPRTKRRDIGRLRLTSNPRGTVEIDGTRAGQTPLIGYPLPAGTHRIRITNERQGRSATITVRIKAGKVVAKNVRLRRNPRMPRR